MRDTTWPMKQLSNNWGKSWPSGMLVGGQYKYSGLVTLGNIYPESVLESSSLGQAEGSTNARRFNEPYPGGISGTEWLRCNWGSMRVASPAVKGRHMVCENVGAEPRLTRRRGMHIPSIRRGP